MPSTSWHDVNANCWLIEVKDYRARPRTKTIDLAESIPNYRASYMRLFDVQGSVAQSDELEQRFFSRSPFLVSLSELISIPGKPLAYWASSAVRKVFDRATRLDEIATPTGGMTTGNNDRFLRMWHEVSVTAIGFGCSRSGRGKTFSKKMVPLQQGRRVPQVVREQLLC